MLMEAVVAGDKECPICKGEKLSSITQRVFWKAPHTGHRQHEGNSLSGVQKHTCPNPGILGDKATHQKGLWKNISGEHDENETHLCFCPRDGPVRSSFTATKSRD